MGGRDSHETVATAVGNGSLASLQQRLVRPGKRDLVDDHQAAGVAGHIDALPQRQGAEQARLGGGDEAPGELTELGVALAQDLDVGQFASAVQRRRLGGTLRGEQAQGASAGGPQQLGHLGQRVRPDAVTAGWGQRFRHIQNALASVVERRSHIQATPARQLGVGVGGAVGPVRLGEADRSRHRLEVAADAERGRGEHDRTLGEDAVPHQPRHRQRRLVHLASEPLPLRDPHDIVRCHRRQLCRDVEDLFGGGCGLHAILVGFVATQSADHPPGHVAHQPQRGAEATVGIFHPIERRVVQGHRQRRSRVEKLEPEIVVQPGQATPGDPLDGLRAEFVGGRTGDPADQFVRLVDDHRVVLGQRRAAVHRINGQQGVVGHHQLGTPCLVAAALDEALLPVGTPLNTEAFAHRDRHLGPRLGAVAGRVVTIGEALRLCLGFDPLAQRNHLGTDLGRGVRGRRCQRFGQLGTAQQRLLVEAQAVPGPVQAGVVGAALENGGGDRASGHLLAGGQGAGDVFAGQLGLQRKGGGGDHDAVAGGPGQVRQGRRQVAQRLAGAGAGLNQQVVADERFGHGCRHLVLAGTLRTLDTLDRGGENRFGQVVLGHRNNLPRRSDRTRTPPQPRADRHRRGCFGCTDPCAGSRPMRRSGEQTIGPSHLRAHRAVALGGTR